jgi:hypothetical protein
MFRRLRGRSQKTAGKASGPPDVWRVAGLPNRMNLKTLLTALFFFVPFAHPREGEASVYQVPQAAEGIFFSITPDIALEDLDVRDAHNRPITTAAARAELRQLFLQNVIDLVTRAAPHGLVQASLTIDLLSRLLRHAIWSAAPPRPVAFCEALQPPSRRFVHNVHKLWITLSVGVFAAAAPLAQFLLQHTVKPVALRC